MDADTNPINLDIQDGTNITIREVIELRQPSGIAQFLPVTVAAADAIAEAMKRHLRAREVSGFSADAEAALARDRECLRLVARVGNRRTSTWMSVDDAARALRFTVPTVLALGDRGFLLLLRESGPGSPHARVGVHALSVEALLAAIDAGDVPFGLVPVEVG